MLTSSILNSITFKNLSGSYPNMWNTLHVNHRHGTNRVIPYYQKFNTNHVVYLQFESDSPDNITLTSFFGLTTIESITKAYDTTYGTSNARYYTNFAITLNSPYWNKNITFQAVQGTTTLTSEPIRTYDLIDELAKGTLKYIKYTNLDRNDSDLDDRFIDWSSIDNEGNYMDFFVDAVDIDINDSEKNEVLDGSQSKVILSASYYPGKTFKTSGIPDYMAMRLGVVSGLDIFTINDIQYIKSEAISQDRFGNSTLFQVSLRLTQKNTIGMNVDNLGYANLVNASVNPVTLNWAFDETDVKTIVVTTSLNRWYFVLDNNTDFTYDIYDPTNTTVISDGVYVSGCVIRIWPVGTNSGTLNLTFVLQITDSSLTNVLATATGTQTAEAVTQTASTDPIEIDWTDTETDTRTFVVTTNMARWYFGTGSYFVGFTVEVYDSTNTTKITNGIYTDGMVVRVTPLSVNYGSSNVTCTLYISNNLNQTLCTFIGLQGFAVSGLSIDRSSCRFHYNKVPYDSNVFTVTHSDTYTYAWTTGTNFSFTKDGDTFTITANANNISGSNYTDQLVITQGGLEVSFGVVQFISPN